MGSAMDMVDQAAVAATKAAAQLQSDEAASKAYVSPVIKTGDRQLDRELADERNRKCVDCSGSEWPNTLPSTVLA